MKVKKWFVLFLAIAACKSHSQDLRPKQLSGQLDSLFSFYEQHNLYFVSVELEKAGELLYQRSVGYENLEKKKKLDSSSVFLVGSITKTYTAVMIMQLVEEGKIRLSDKLSRFYPQVPNASGIDVEMLLRHRSGLFNYTSNENFLSEVSSPVSRQELLERFYRLDTIFSPGTRYEYSNTNYMLLGFILEDLTGDKYENQLKKRILDKLNLKNTYYGRPDDRSNFALSYQYQDGQWTETQPEWNTDWALGAGAISATVNDISAFYKGLFSGKLVSEESLRQMMDLRDNYGLGLAGIPYGRETFYGHAGGIENYRSICGYNPGDRILFTQVSTAAFNGNPNEISIQVLNAVYENKVSYPDTVQKIEAKVPVDVLRTYEGTYSASGVPLDIRIFVKDSTLQGQATGQAAFPLTAYSNTEFGYEDAGISMGFFMENETQKFHFKQGQIQADFSRKP
ncbi:CubicO group peptidase (beta-lactamase class C family) [Anseongella ginsenosidimutans]|uniref:CubicO group peptidase (Beta-lactamase class C family) n=1 Tax=Anseongella ginsenosidimutans TaxID=496056 RepID=A0A4R3KPI3_9SPHI|nr:serine hydrolase domain-containing protein [Anseongella ginsenosidimutans]QEC52670.1 beta-lactamase family protein [Anseongella ginsenosidimutans]TCS86598.1 CubicO group peptidase (beta-lactamase class C family) [Anseongella ginsenosidimutans]